MTVPRESEAVRQELYSELKLNVMPVPQPTVLCVGAAVARKLSLQSQPVNLDWLSLRARTVERCGSGKVVHLQDAARGFLLVVMMPACKACRF